jgi:CRISPR/Cas system CSM-associated protein Csm2 small subunit
MASIFTSGALPVKTKEQRKLSSLAIKPNKRRVQSQKSGPVTVVLANPDKQYPKLVKAQRKSERDALRMIDREIAKAQAAERKEARLAAKTVREAAQAVERETKAKARAEAKIVREAAQLATRTANAKQREGKSLIKAIMRTFKIETTELA